ncbi:MAG TPA: hypothetical protein QF549_00280 [Candidatus Saccharimonadaceae bacterium]|nr:hypothetical protein [Candidatus Saccharimonadaceae bacterium]
MQEHNDSDEGLSVEKNKHAKRRRGLSTWHKVVLGVILAAIVTVGSYAGYIYAVSPNVIRNPKLEHYHFRMQILVDGKAEDFGTQAYQTGYAKDQCNANLPEQPIHFHDNKDQFTHIHWEGMTGGMVMKYYGWNYIGGIDGALGYKLNDLSDIQQVTTHGNYLPDVPKDDTFYIYTGDENSYKKQSFEDWKNKDLEDFFGKTSNSPAHELNKSGDVSVLDILFPKAYAHGTAEDADGDDGAAAETDQEKLTRINNLLGNVVIFVQKDEPTDQQIKARFNDLEPLTDSTCGG